MYDVSDNLLNDLMNTVSEIFNLEVLEATSINLGWLNKRWKVRTNKGLYILKQYNKERYKSTQTSDIHTALLQQNRLYEAGLPCPRLLTDQNNVLHTSASGESFSIMEFCPGIILKTGQARELQMKHLGQMTGYDGYFLVELATVFKGRVTYIKVKG